MFVQKFKVTEIQAHIEYLVNYLSRTIMAISEAWEIILLKMDDKLAKYAEGKPPGSLAADFLELLKVGVPTPKLVSFLSRDLTEKGLQKLEHSIEMYYGNIQVKTVKS
jgi:anaphase-promoting complex subunit 4